MINVLKTLFHMHKTALSSGHIGRVLAIVLLVNHITLNQKDRMKDNISQSGMLAVDY